MAANILLTAFYAVELRRRQVLPVSLGSANDVVGSIGTAFMVPVVLAVSPSRWTRRLGLTATGVLTLAGPALVLGLIPFAVQMPIAIGAFQGLAGWIVLSSRGRRGTLPERVTRLGVLSGGGVLAGGAVAGAGLLLPEGSPLRRAALAVGGAPAVLGGLAIPIWFLQLGRALSTDVPGPRRSSFHRTHRSTAATTCERLPGATATTDESTIAGHHGSGFPSHEDTQAPWVDEPTCTPTSRLRSPP